MGADIAADLPRIRVAPSHEVGWLWFMVIGGGPGGVFFAAALDDQLQPPWSTVGLALGVPLALAGAGVVLWGFLRTQRRVARMREAALAPRVPARVVYADESTATFRSEGISREQFTAARVTLTLALQSPAGNTVEVTQRAYFGLEEIERLRSGATIDVSVHPHDPLLVFVHRLA